MLKLMPIEKNSPFIVDILKLLSQYGGAIFSNLENPQHSFLKTLNSNRYKGIAGFRDNELIAFCVLYNFQKISPTHFSCYIYGCAKRKVAKELEIFLNYIMKDLKRQGCVVLRLETREYNLPMRHLARRLKLRKIGFMECCAFEKGKFINNIIYEKKL